jgi:putative ABC transport system substrate-binding protein
MKRREFIGLIGGAAVSPLAARAQQSVGKATRAIGVLSPFSRSDSETWHLAFRQGLRELGWVEGESIRIDTDSRKEDRSACPN